MDMNGRYDQIEDVLIQLHVGKGQWFGWSDSKNKVYANLILHDDSITKPTEKSLTDALAKQQSDFDAQAYSRNRETEYPTIEECVHAMLDNDNNELDTLQAKRAEIKLKYPKGG